MNSLSDKTIKIIDDIINFSEINNINFYSKILNMMSFLFEDFSIGIFFYENLNCVLKAGIKNKKSISSYNFNFNYIKVFFNTENKIFEIKTLKDDFLFSNTLIVKLQVKNSTFGFCTLSSENKISDEIKNSFKYLVNVLSYKIKDYELNEVFKMQLKALEEAINEKDIANEIIKKQHKKLQELDKTKNSFLANISHELKTPLNAIIGFSQALDSKIFGELNPKQAEYINDIHISSLHLLNMINEILDISKIEAHAMRFNPDKLNPKIIIDEVISILEPLYLNKNITIEFNSSFNGMIYADYQKFRQILFNLLSNAIKFTQNNGKIEIIQSSNKKDYILKIKDNGIGIEKKYHNKIFKKFTQINNIHIKNESSTGLGLTITKELVKLHNGKISLESELNKGSTFILEFKKIVL